MATTGITKALEGFDRLKARVKNAEIKKHIKEERGYAGLAALAGAAIAGAADAKYPEKKLGPVPIVAAGSAVLALGGMIDVIPGGVYIGMLGVGGLCYYVGKASHDHVASSAA